MSESADLLPKTTTECNRILRSVIFSLENPQPHHRARARKLIEELYKEQCKTALEWIYEKYHLHPSLHVRSLAKEAREYELRLER
jgi:hypothetical protein